MDYNQPQPQTYESGLMPNETSGFLLPDGAPALNNFPTAAPGNNVIPLYPGMPVNTPAPEPMLFGFPRHVVLIAGAVGLYLLLRRS